MRVAYEAMLAIEITHIVTDTRASANGVVTISTPMRKTSRPATAVTAVIRTGANRARRYPNTGEKRWPMNGPATTSATSVVEPPIRRTTTGRNAAMTPMYTPAMRPEKASRRKFARTRSADQLRSGTRTKVAATRLVVAPVPVAIDRNCAAVIYRSGVKSPPGRGGRTPPGRGGYGRRVPYG